MQLTILLSIFVVMTVHQFNTYMIFHLPSAYWCGVRLKQLTSERAMTTVRLSWFNKNPFRSMFWAVQGMAAELASGALIMAKIKASGKRVSMLVVQNEAIFTKKAVGRIIFTCEQGRDVDHTLSLAMTTEEASTVWLTASGIDEAGDQVAVFKFKWSVKLKS
jgi:hypothetical protein